MDNWITDLLSSKDSASSRRATGMLIIVCMLVILFLYVFKVIPISVWKEMLSSWIAGMSIGASLIAMTTIDKFTVGNTNETKQEGVSG